jgi:hypothetical protein
MKPSSAVDMCNLSLDFLKQSPINSISEPITSTEYVMARWYDMERMAALRAHPWKFATKRVLLTPDLSATPPFGFAYAYNLPEDYIRKLTLGDDYLGGLRLAHVIENGQILAPSGNTGSASADSTTLYLRYIYDCSDVNKFDALFIKFFALQMAVDLSTKFAISASLMKNLGVMFEEVNTLARAVNGQDAPIKRVQYSKTLTKRRGLPGGIYASKYTIFET